MSDTVTPIIPSWPPGLDYAPILKATLNATVLQEAEKYADTRWLQAIDEIEILTNLNGTPVGTNYAGLTAIKKNYVAKALCRLFWSYVMYSQSFVRGEIRVQQGDNLANFSFLNQKECDPNIYRLLQLAGLYRSQRSMNLGTQAPYANTKIVPSQTDLRDILRQQPLTQAAALGYYIGAKKITSRDKSITITPSFSYEEGWSLDLVAIGDGGITNLTGIEGITVTGTGIARVISGKSLNDRVTGHGRDIATNRGLANANTERLLKTTPNNDRVTNIKAGTDITFQHVPDPKDPTKGTLTINSQGGSSIPDVRLFSASSQAQSRIVTNNVHALEIYLSTPNHHDKGLVMWEGSKVDVPNRATKEVARFTHNDATGECWLRMGLPGKHGFYYYQKDWASDGILKIGYGAKEGTITSSQLKALVNLKPLLVDGTQNVVAKIKAGDNVTFAYSNTLLTVNSVILELDDGTSVKKVVKKIKAGTNITFGLANDILTINSTGGSGTDADWVDKFKRLVSSTNQDVLRITNIGGTRIQLHPEFSKYQIFNHLSSSSQYVFNDVPYVKFIERKNGNKTQQFKWEFLNSNNFFTVGRYNYGQTNNTVGIAFKHQADVLPGSGHAYGESSLLVYDYNGNHSTKLQVKERRIRAGSEASKSFTPTGVSSTYDAKIAQLEAKIAKLEKWLKIKL